MNEPTKASEPVLRKRKWPMPLIWIIPAVSLIVAGLYFRDYLRNHGPSLVIEFSDASGLRVGEAKVLYRGAEVGKVSEIELSESHKHALVKVEFDKQDSDFATKGAVFWIVRPEVSDHGFNGLGTLFSGPYIAAEPGKGDEDLEKAEGLAKPPRPWQEGEIFNLTMRKLGHLAEDSAVTYKGVQVGTVEKVSLANEADHLNVEIKVWSRYAALVRENSKFWISTGFDVEGGIFSGIHMKLDSLKTLTAGGVAFASPDEKDFKGPAKKNSTFAIEEDPKREWELWAPKISVVPKAVDSEKKPEPIPAPKREKDK
jgi:paraquat-inducible protein B